MLRLPGPEMRRGSLREPGQGEELPGQPLPGELPRELEPPGELPPREPVLLGQLPRELEPPGQLPPPEPELLPSPREPPEKPVLRSLARLSAHWLW